MDLDGNGVVDGVEAQVMESLVQAYGAHSAEKMTSLRSEFQNLASKAATDHHKGLHASDAYDPNARIDFDTCAHAGLRRTLLSRPRLRTESALQSHTHCMAFVQRTTLAAPLPSRRRD